MFLDEKNLAILIITRATHRLLILSLASVQMVFLLGSLNLPVNGQPAHNDALNVREHIYKGNSLMQRHDYEGAIAEYEQALLIDSTSTTAKDNIVLTHNNWGIDLFHQKKYDEAREQWNTALKLNPYDRNAKNNLNVLRVQMTKLGLPPNGPATNPAGKAASDDDAKSGGAVLPKGAQTAKEDTTPVPNAVIIGRPLSTSTQASFSGTTESLPASSTAGSGSGAAGTSGSSGPVVIMKPATSSSSSSFSGFSNPPTSSNVPSAFSAQPSKASGAQAINMSAPAASNTSSSLNSSNIEDKLAALENKVYGRSSKEVPILQRLERLERDTSSRPSLGSISDRVQTLIKTYGL